MRLHVAIGADHGGFELKQELVRRLSGSVDILDKGAHEYDPGDDYPDYVVAVARAVADGEVDRGIIICGSGVGACVAANKIPGVRACVCHDTYSAHQGVEHDDQNVLCLGARVIGVEVATELTVAFLMARFSAEERHVRRLEKVAALDRTSHVAQEDVPEPSELELNAPYEEARPLGEEHEEQQFEDEELEDDEFEGEESDDD